MADQRPVFVVGATGKQGGAVARTLLERGHNVRALTRNMTKPAAQTLAAAGAEIVEGSVEDPSTLAPLFDNVKAVFAMTTFFECGIDAEVAQGKAIAEAARVAAVPHLIFSSVAAADQHTGVPHFESKYEIEQHIEGLGLPNTIVRPSFFMENITSPYMLPGLLQDNYALPLSSEREQPLIALADLGEFVTASIENPEKFKGRKVDIASDNMTGHRAAQSLSQATGHRIRYVQVPLDAVRQSSPELASMWEWFETHDAAIDTGALRKEYPEVLWRTFDKWTAEQDWRALGF